MKTIQIISVVGLAAVLGARLMAAEPFNCGSTEAYGAINITSDTTLDLPPDGIFNCTSITVATGKTLRFNRNPLNTPVYLLATKDVLINGTIEVSGATNNGAVGGKGGPGGFDGGYGGSPAGEAAGDGLGPGRGRGTGYAHPGGVYGSNISLRYYYSTQTQPTYINNGVYGNALIGPLIGGSGGAGSAGRPGLGGGGGGGALLIASNTKVVLNGSLRANGGSPTELYSSSHPNGAGSGGAIRLVAPIVTGTGSLQAPGGNSGNRFDYPSYSYTESGTRGGGPGRIRIDCLDTEGFRSLVTGDAVATRGRQMFVFAPVMARLDLIEVASRAIPEGTANGVQIDLPAGASSNQVVKVQARNFTNDVPIMVVVTPDNGSSSSYEATISQTSGNPPSVSVNVVIPTDTVSRIHAWTR